MTQARTVWFFARLYNDGYGTEEHLEAARHGFEFLRERMWDRQFGGFFWTVDVTGEKPVNPNKHLYGQGFALYALAEFIKATQDTSASRLAGELFAAMEEHAYDPEHGGYYEWFGRDWSPGPRDKYVPVGTPPRGKTMNTHLHLMEPFTTYYEVTGDERVRERLIELIAIQGNAVVRKNLGACTDKFEGDWTPLPGPEFARVSYGHDIENVWLLILACDVAGLHNGPRLDLYRQLMDYSLEYGFDHEKGGYYYVGNFDEPADNRLKEWWVEAEGMVAALYMYRLTGEGQYFALFEKMLDWIYDYQVDWEYGDWHARIMEDGQPAGGKAHAWKSPYHNGRAVMECLKLMSALPAK